MTRAFADALTDGSVCILARTQRVVGSFDNFEAYIVLGLARQTDGRSANERAPAHIALLDRRTARYGNWIEVLGHTTPVVQKIAQTFRRLIADARRIRGLCNTEVKFEYWSLPMTHQIIPQTTDIHAIISPLCANRNRGALLSILDEGGIGGVLEAGRLDRILNENTAWGPRSTFVTALQWPATRHSKTSSGASTPGIWDLLVSEYSFSVIFSCAFGDHRTVARQHCHMCQVMGKAKDQLEETFEKEVSLWANVQVVGNVLIGKKFLSTCS